MAIGGRDAVNGDAGEGVGHAGLQEEGPLAVGQHRVVHERVVPGKLDHLIWEVLGGAEGAEGFAGALQEAALGERGPTPHIQPPPPGADWVPPALPRTMPGRGYGTRAWYGTHW